MTFVYDLASTNVSILAISKVRLELNDIVDGVGVRPDNTNFSNEEIALWLSEESNSVMLAAARACDALARAWSVMVNETVGPRKYEYGKVADNWAKHASALRSESVDGTGGGIAYLYNTQRADPYRP